MIPTWRFFFTTVSSPVQWSLGTQRTTPFEVDNGYKFSLDIPTTKQMIPDKLDEEVKGAISTMQRAEGQKVQVTPSSRRSFCNCGKSDPMQAWDVTFH